MGLQIRRGYESERLTITPAAGEPIWIIDTEKLWIGDGTTVGGNLASPEQLVGVNDSPEFYSIIIDTTATVGTLIFSSDTGTYITSRAQLIGPTGYTGSKGDTGFTGSRGDTGFTGSQGNLGYTGSLGFTGSAGTSGANGYTGSQGDLGYTGSGGTGFTGSSGSLGYTGSAGSFDQTLNTTDNVVFKSAKSTQLLSSGGYPLDSNGQALIRTTNTQTPALIVSNYTSGLLPEIILRGYGQNRPGTVSGTTAANEALAMEGSRGTMTSPTALGSGDLFFSVAGGGYDGTRWSTDSAFFPAGIFATSTEAMAGSASTTTNAGSRFVMRVQPQGVQLNSTSRLNFHIGSWTAASGTTPPQYAISEGSGADGTTPTLISSSGTSTWLGYGKTFRQFINSEMRIIGVPYEDSAPDNPSLINTNGISLISGRRSGVSGRRDTLQNNDTIGFIGFRGQTAANGNATGSTGSVFFASALGTWSGSNYGTRVTLTSANSGTTTITNRLKLDNVEHVYASALHSFKTANEGTTIMSLSTSSIFITAPIDSAIQRTAGGLVTGMNVGSTTYTLYSYVAATYPGAKFVIKINDGTDLHMTEMLVITDGTNTSYNEFAAITNNGDLGTFAATVSGSDVLIRFTTKVGITNASAKVTAQLMTA
jgi:hypothetical protein